MPRQKPKQRQQRWRRPAIQRDKSRDAPPSAGECGKVGFHNRRQARRASANMPGHLRPYHCGNCSMWHIGHLPLDVIRGNTTATEHYYGEEADSDPDSPSHHE